MFEHSINPFHNGPVLDCCETNRNDDQRQYNTALNQFKSTWIKGLVFRLFSRLLRRKTLLHDLNEIKSGLNLHGSHYAGVKAVRIDSIIGTEGKASDFDMGFHPVNETSRERWVNMAMVYVCCFSLPPVQLTQIGDAYFVRDGHHRISVSRAFGQTSIDAEVVIWKASPPFPWQPDTTGEHVRGLKQADISA